MGLFHFMQGFLSSGTLGFHCTENIIVQLAVLTSILVLQNMQILIKDLLV
jgi:hypothetical protein